MKRTAALSLLVVALMSCSFLDENTPDTDPEPTPGNSAPEVQLTATPPSGDAPLPVILTAEASDADGDDLSYSWSLEGVGDTATVSQTFAATGSYPVTVTVSDGQTSTAASVTVVVSEADGEPTPDPDPQPNPAIDLSVIPSPAGPVPWGVTYEVAAAGAPAGSTITVTCAGQAAADLGAFETLEVEDTFSCIHTTTEEAVVATLTATDGEVLATEEQTADVQPSNGVPFGNTWVYEGQTGDSFVETATFAITEAVSETAGRGAGGYLNDALVNYPEYPDPQPATFTLSAAANTLTLNSTSYLDDRTLVFVGQVGNSQNSRQVFLAPNTQDTNSNEGFLYTTD